MHQYFCARHSIYAYISNIAGIQRVVLHEFEHITAMKVVSLKSYTNETYRPSAPKVCCCCRGCDWLW